MEWLTPQIDCLLALQNFRELTGGIFNNFFMFITSCGEISIPTIVIALIYWCVNSKFGIYLLWNWSLGSFFCQFLKSCACVYRPWVLDTRIQPVEEAMKMAGGYSFPSGHTQTAVSVWGGLAVLYKNKILRAFLILLILLIGFSINYFVVHTTQDVIVSIVVSVVLLFLVKKIMDWVEKGKNRDIVVYVSVLIMSLLLVLFEHYKSYPIDYMNGELLVNPVIMRMYSFPKIGLLMGIFKGWFLNGRLINFEGSKGSVNQKAVRFIVGIAILLILFSKLTTILCFFTAKQYAMFLSSFISALFVTFIFPAIIVFIEKNKN